jgi:hypothetical protein
MCDVLALTHVVKYDNINEQVLDAVTSYARGFMGKGGTERI